MKYSVIFRAAALLGILAVVGITATTFGTHARTAGAAYAITQPQPETKQVIGNPSGTLTPGILIGNTLYLSGQLGSRGKADGVGGETKAAIEAAQNILKMAKMELSDVVAVTAYLVDISDFSAFNTAYTSMFTTQPRPTRTTVAVKELVGGAKVELTMTAVKTR
jgi:enamine deaminase RidA (YjgF/YER057c/UK114 family)